MIVFKNKLLGDEKLLKIHFRCKTSVSTFNYIYSIITVILKLGDVETDVKFLNRFLEIIS